jgi:purine-cytosine permease-like protein
MPGHTPTPDPIVDPMLAPKHARLLSFALAAAVLPLVALYVLLLKISTPSETGGMDATSAMICYFAFTFIFGALIVVALNFSSQLRREAKSEYQTP